MRRILAIFIAVVLSGCGSDAPKPSLALPTVSTTTVSAITGGSAVSGGSITSDGGSPVVGRGVCWSTFTGPTIANNITIDGTGTGEFESTLTGLEPSTNYFVRAYATNAVGTQYGNEVQFTTSTSVIAICAGGSFSLAVKSDNSLWAWGRNNQGQLGDGTVVDKSTPVLIGTGYKAVAAGQVHSLGLKTDGTLMAWGSNDDGALGDATNTDRHVPTLVGTGFKAIAAGFSWSLAIKTDGTLWAWGENSINQLGDGNTGDLNAPTQVGTNFVSIDAGYTHTVGVKADGSLWIWGGDVLSMGSHYDDPTQVGAGYSAASAGEAHSLAVQGTGALYSWGLNPYGQLGYNNSDEFDFPTLVGPDFDFIEAGGHSSFGIKAGSLYYWGNNQVGQLGTGAVANSVLAPVLVGPDYVAVSTNGFHVLAIKTDGTLWSWGMNFYYELGIGNNLEKHTPQHVVF